jgi:hypothetical protein
MALLGVLETETDADVLAAVARVAAELMRRLAHDAGEDVAQALARRIATGHRSTFEATGLDARRGESQEVARRRAWLLELVGGIGRDPALVASCAERARDHLERARALPRGATEVVLRLGASAERPGLQRALLAGVRDAGTPQDRRARLFALSGFRSPRALDRTLRAARDARLAPAVDRATLLMQLLASREAAGPTWTWLQQHWAQLEGEMPPILLARLAGELAGALPLTRLDEIHPFFARHPLQAGQRTLRQLREQIAIARRLARRAGPELQRLLCTDGD